MTNAGLKPRPPCLYGRGRWCHSHPLHFSSTYPPGAVSATLSPEPLGCQDSSAQVPGAGLAMADRESVDEYPDGEGSRGGASTTIQIRVPGPDVPASPGSLLERQILGLHPRPTESDSLEGRITSFKKPLQATVLAAPLYTSPKAPKGRSSLIFLLLKNTLPNGHLP